MSYRIYQWIAISNSTYAATQKKNGAVSFMNLFNCSARDRSLIFNVFCIKLLYIYLQYTRCRQLQTVLHLHIRKLFIHKLENPRYYKTFLQFFNTLNESVSD